MTVPKLFISYSWTNPDHEAWVLQLATELRESGVDVMLDKWDLKEGHDAHVFMEKMVNDSQIKKVALICDEGYVEKANARAGGVGTEAQIISSSIYEKSDQDKFVAVVKERDADGSAFLPVYYKSRIYIDLSDQSTYADNFDQLLRWIFDKPLYKKPEIGAVPSFLSDGDSAAILTTSSRFKRALEAIKAGKQTADGSVREYFDNFSAQLERLRIADGNGDDEFDELVIASIEGFLPYRNEVIELFKALAQYRDGPDTRRSLHHFFETIAPYMERTPEITSWKEWDFDNYRFIVHELFLHCIAILLRHERFITAGYLLANDYYTSEESSSGGDVMASFGTFRKHMQSLDYRKDRLKLGRLSVRADMLKERCKGIGYSFKELLQADFVLFMRDRLDRQDSYGFW